MLHLLGSYVEFVCSLLPMKFVLGLIFACPTALIKLLSCVVWLLWLVIACLLELMLAFLLSLRYAG